MDPKRLAHLLRHLAAAAFHLDLVAMRRRLQHEVRWQREARLVVTSGLFDEPYYLGQRPAARHHPGGALMHYLERGGFEGLQPNPLFDSAWYLQQNLDVAEAGAQPLVHFIRAGSQEGRNPNPYFDLRWYMMVIGKLAGMRSSDGYPLRHYLEHGADLAVDTSSRFDSDWYLQHNPDAQRSGMPPLVHYLTIGAPRGASPNRREQHRTPGRPLADLPLHCVKPFRVNPASEEIALLALTTPTRVERGQAEAFLEHLSRRGVRVLVVGATPALGGGPTTERLMAAADGLHLQPEASTPFKAWAHLMRRLPGLGRARHMHWLDARMLELGGHPDLLDRALDAMRRPAAPVITLARGGRDGSILPWTGWITFTEEALCSPAFHAFVQRVTDLPAERRYLDWQEADFVRSFHAARPGWESAVQLDDAQLSLSGWKQRLEALPREDELPATAAPPEAPPLAPAEPSPRLLFLGPWNYNNGLGVASRSYLSALRRTHFDLHLEPVARPFHVHRRIAPAVPMRDFAGPADVAVIHLNPDSLASVPTADQRRGIDAAGLRVGLWVWETERVPASWLPAFDQVDALWAPTEFCKKVFAQHTDLPIDVVPHVVGDPAIRPNPQEIRRTKQELGIALDERVILYVFDGASFLVRKNPFALIRAFESSGLATQGWRLVLKTKHLFDSRDAGSRLQALADACEGCLLIDRSLDRQAMRSLMSMADIYASPHCAEGFGLTVAEAMVAGKLVVATDYSGTRDFLDASTGMPVRYTLVTLEEDHGPYLKGDTWANIDEQHLCERLVEAAALVEAGDGRLGQAARARILDTLSADRVAKCMQQSLSKHMHRKPRD
ncbi:glycosyltransferase family 4 protein [uncultured Pseudacidovorax sp.]|uniref:glycosyltransferase family 4 protein n=1 Tax=uncultured Pseudacidovorax sp. TaxID=679313 RepID=UPI0025DCD3EF|nr:glycosyltransferase family 4 protein [uncultured Pseudacidovorax sp.]